MILLLSLGSSLGVLSCLITSKASNEDLPQTPQDELVKKSLFIFVISTFEESFKVTSILF